MTDKAPEGWRERLEKIANGEPVWGTYWSVLTPNREPHEAFLTDLRAILSAPEKATSVPSLPDWWEAERDKAMVNGMVIAAGILVQAHGAEVEAEEILGAAGVTSIADCRKYGVDAYDANILRRVFAHMKRTRNRYRDMRAARLPAPTDGAGHGTASSYHADAVPSETQPSKKAPDHG